MNGDGDPDDPGPEPARGFDAVSALMAVVAVAAVGWAVWHRYGPPAAPEPPGVGKPVPALRLLDPETSEPIVLLGLRGKVVWITFWSAAASEGPADLAALEAVWKRFRPRPRFAMAAAAAESDRPALVRAAVAASKADLPAYLASPATLRAFGARPGRLPLHVLLDPSGRVAAVAQGRDPSTLARLTERARRWLDEIDPPDSVRFARR